MDHKISKIIGTTKLIIHITTPGMLTILGVIVAELALFYGIYIMSEGNMNEFVLSVFASLTAAVVAGLIGYFWGGMRYKQALFSAPEKYVKHLDK